MATCGSLSASAFVLDEGVVPAPSYRLQAMRGEHFFSPNANIFAKAALPAHRNCSILSAMRVQRAFGRTWINQYGSR